MQILVALVCAAAAMAAVTALPQQRAFRPNPERDFQYDAQPQEQQQQQQQQPARPAPQAVAPRGDFQPKGDPDRYTTPIPIVRFEKEQSADGSYKSSYETGNNIVAEETGFLKNVGVKDEEALVQHGSYTYTGDDGVVYTVTYTADEQGFRPEGLHLPTPPPVPAEIQKSLDLIYASIREQQEQEARQGKLQKIEPEGQQGGDNYPAPPRGFRQ